MPFWRAVRPRSGSKTLARSANKEEDTIDENIPKTMDQANMMAVEWAIEKAKGCKIPEEINTGASYRTEYTFGYDVLYGPILRKSNGRNMISTDDCLAYMASNDEIVVVLYHAAEEASGGEENTKAEIH